MFGGFTSVRSGCDGKMLLLRIMNGIEELSYNAFGFVSTTCFHF